MTIIDAIKEVMRKRGSPMTAREAYDAIVAANLYEFHAQNPAHIVLSQIRRHSEGIDFPSGAPTKHFQLVGENRFSPLDRPKRIRTKPRTASSAAPAVPGRVPSLGATLQGLQDLHRRYVALLKQRINAELRRLSPTAFETFARELLQVYGFEDLHVTKVSGDGGIDGYGKLRVGLAYLNVAFQCKRWTKGNIQRTEIDRFRGAAQGDFEQGIFFATTTFSQGAIEASIKRGAVPIVLVDSNAIVDLMIEKRFGVQAESLVIPTYALDLALNPEPRLRDEPR
ncbi:MAG: restriction endonuclease [Candidatus Rokubacteria bacterium]|nr:restriction endonuclease [Candidatus Rokubacteria bacterium]